MLSHFYETTSFKFARVIFVLIVIQVGFGTYAVIIKLTAQSEGVDPMVFSFFRDLGCFPILFIAAVVLEGFVKPKLKDIPIFFALGLTGMFGNQVLYIYGVYFTSPTITSIFQPLIPVITVALALILKIEPFDSKDLGHWAKLWGICTAGGGAIIMVGAQGSILAGNTQSIIGFVLLLGNTTCMAIYVLLQKKFLYLQDINGNSTPMYPPITSTAYAYFMGSILIGLACIPYGAVQPSVFLNLTPSVLYPLLYAVFINSALCYGLINYANTLTSATIVTAFWPVQVPVASIESYFAFGDSLGWLQYVGALFIIVGLITVRVANYRQEKEQVKGKSKMYDETSDLIKK